MKEYGFLKSNNGVIPVIERNDSFQAVINRVIKVKTGEVSTSPTTVSHGDIFISAWVDKKVYIDGIPSRGVGIFKICPHPEDDEYKAFTPKEDVVFMKKLYVHEAIKELAYIGKHISGINAELDWFVANTPVTIITDPDDELFN